MANIHSDLRPRPLWPLGVTLLLVALAAVGRTAPEAPRPASITASCGDLTVRIDGPKMWTLSRIEYRGTRLGIEESAWGTVFNFPDVGFVGTGHREGGVEQVDVLELYLDGRLVETTAPVVRGRSFRVRKRSRIRDLALDSTVTVEGDRIHETASVRTERAVPVRFGYHFMHAWTPSATEYLAGADAGGEVAGALRDEPEFDRQFYINRDMDWIGVYDGPSGRGAVSHLLARPAAGGAMMKLWNCPRIYRKFYLQCFTDAKIPAGFDGRYEMVTGFFEAPAPGWRDAARSMAVTLRK